MRLVPILILLCMVGCKSNSDPTEPTVPPTRVSISGVWDYKYTPNVVGTFTITENGGIVTGTADSGVPLTGAFNTQTYRLVLNKGGDGWVTSTVNQAMNSMTGRILTDPSSATWSDMTATKR